MALKQDIGLPCLNCNACSGFKIHGWRKICTECNCSVGNHDISDESALPILEEMKLSDKPFYTSYQESLALAEKMNKTWLPIGIKYNEVNEFCNQYRETLDKSVSEKLRKKKIRMQIPVQDRCVEKFCYLDTTMERQEAEKFLQHRNNRDIGVGYVIRLGEESADCMECHQSIEGLSLCVTADLPGASVAASSSSAAPAITANSTGRPIWHAACFKCNTCHETLVDLVFGSPSSSGSGAQLYCVRHYASTVRPRCYACDELIFATEFVRHTADEDNQPHEYHTNHFACSLCDQSLAKRRYISMGSPFDVSGTRPVCTTCYDTKVANRCNRCHLVIKMESQDVCYRQHHWHSDCFTCSGCGDNLVTVGEFALGASVGTEEQQVFCEKCHLENLAPRCRACEKPVDYGKKLVEFGDDSWHYDCFKCSQCQLAIGNESFVTHTLPGNGAEEKSTVCTSCFDKLFAKKCDHCLKIIKDGGVNYKDSSFHYQCFTCHHCKSKICDVKFSVREGNFYCRGCTDQLFANKCNKCSRLITGEPNFKYVKFDERCWHSNCFCCSKCNSSLVDKSFIKKEADVLCIQCGA